jgi:NitT/TauT family transport system substrate-binding protein
VLVILLLQALTVAIPDPPTSPEYLPLRVAAAYGDFASEGLEVTLRPARSEALAAEALARGTVDLAATTLDAVLRFGSRQSPVLPRVLFGLTAAPPVALLASASAKPPIRSVEDLRGLRVGVTSPGAPERAWLSAVLTAPPGEPIRAEVVSVGVRAPAGALRQGAVDAALVHEPAASDLLESADAVLLADLRDPASVIRAIGQPTVNAAVFVGAGGAIRPDVLAAVRRALVAAERRIATAPPAELAARLPQATVGAGREFARRLETTTGLYLPHGEVTAAQLAASITLIRAHLPIPGSVKIPRPADLLAPATP